jgi:predicted transcriptional regulator
MMATQNHNIPQPEKEIKSLHELLTVLTGNDDYLELLKIIHQPGYTTIAEFYFVSRLVQNMQAQLRGYQQLQQTLMEGSRAIIEGVPTR